MLTRTPTDVEGFFWRQVVAQSPLTPVKGTPYDEAWRAINQWLIHDSIAGRQRNVFLRNDGKGGFDDVSGTVGLDLEQDGRSFAVLDADRDGDPDLAIMAARQAPQLRLFRNDVSGRGGTFTLRLTGSGDEQPRRDRGARRDRDRPRQEDADRLGRIGLPVAALEDADRRARRQHAHPKRHRHLAVRRRADVHRREASTRGPASPRAAGSRRTPSHQPASRRPRRRGHRHRSTRRAAPGCTNRSRRRRSRHRIAAARPDRSPRSPASRRCFCSGQQQMRPGRPRSTPWRVDAPLSRALASPRWPSRCPLNLAPGQPRPLARRPRPRPFPAWRSSPRRPISPWPTASSTATCS